LGKSTVTGNAGGGLALFCSSCEARLLSRGKKGKNHALVTANSNVRWWVVDGGGSGTKPVYETAGRTFYLKREGKCREEKRLEENPSIMGCRKADPV